MDMTNYTKFTDNTASKNESGDVENKEFNRVNEEAKRELFNFNFPSKEYEAFNCWMNETSTNNGPGGLSQPANSGTQGKDKINLLKSLWSEENKNNVEEYSKNCQMDNTLKSAYFSNYLSSIFNAQETENMAPLSPAEVSKEISYDQKRNDTTFFNTRTSGSDQLNEKEKQDLSADADACADSTCGIDTLEKNYAHTFLTHSMRNGNGDIFSMKPAGISYMPINEKDQFLQKSKTHYNGERNVNNQEYNSSMRLFNSLDMDSIYRNNLQKMNIEEDVFSLLIKNKEKIDWEYAESKNNIENVYSFEKEKLAFLKKNSMSATKALNGDEYSEKNILETEENIKGNRKNMTTTTTDIMTSSNNSSNINNIASAMNTSAGNVTSYNNRSNSNITRSMTTTTNHNNGSSSSVTHSNNNTKANNNTNGGISNDCMNACENKDQGHVFHSLNADKNNRDLEKRNPTTSSNAWNNAYLGSYRINENNPFGDTLEPYAKERAFNKNALNGASNMHNSDMNAAGYTNRRNSICSKTQVNKQGHLNNTSDFSWMHNNFTPSSNNKSKYIPEEEIFANDDCYMKNKMNGSNEAIKNNIKFLKDMRSKPVEHVRTTNPVNFGNSNRSPNVFSALKYLEKYNCKENTEAFNEFICHMPIEKETYTKFPEIYKYMLIDLIATSDNDVELFECIVNTIIEFHKNKTIMKTAHMTQNNLVNTNDMPYTNSDVMNTTQHSNDINNAFIKNYLKTHGENPDASHISHLINTLREGGNNNSNTNSNRFIQFPKHDGILKAKTLPERYVGSYLDYSKRTTADELHMYNTMNSLRKGTIQSDDPTNNINNLYMRSLQNRLKTENKFDKDQVFLSQIIKEKANANGTGNEYETEHGTGENKHAPWKNEEDVKSGHYISGNTSSVKFCFEKDATEKTQKLKGEERKGLLDDIQYDIDESARYKTMNRSVKKSAVDTFHDDNNGGNNNDQFDLYRTNFYNTFDGKTSTTKEMKPFFSNSLPKEVFRRYDDSVQDALTKSSFMNTNIRNKQIPSFSQYNETSDFNCDRRNDVKKNKLFRNVLQKNESNLGSNKNFSTSHYGCGFDSRKSYKNDVAKSTVKSKNNPEIKKLSSEELKAIITKEDENCLRTILDSLYQDRILPLVFNLSGRAEEMKCKDVIIHNLLNAYSLFPAQYNVKATDNGDDNLVLFTDRTISDDYFIYLNNLEDNYSEAMWTHFSDYLEEIAKSDDPSVYEFSGGRYGMAKELQRRNLSFFKNYCLGELCHIVHLCTNKKMIAYEQKFLKPISKCHKYTNAKLGRLSVGNEHTDDYITTIDELKYYIKALLKYYKGGFNISTLKKKMKTRFNKQICESVFHCIKLIEVLQLEELKDICVIDTDLKFICSATKQNNVSS